MQGSEGILRTTLLGGNPITSIAMQFEENKAQASVASRARQGLPKTKAPSQK
jgi:hypothetical protein